VDILTPAYQIYDPFSWQHVTDIRPGILGRSWFRFRVLIYTGGYIVLTISAGSSPMLPREDLITNPVKEW